VHFCRWVRVLRIIARLHREQNQPEQASARLQELVNRSAGFILGRTKVDLRELVGRIKRRASGRRSDRAVSNTDLEIPRGTRWRGKRAYYVGQKKRVPHERICVEAAKSLESPPARRRNRSGTPRDEYSRIALPARLVLFKSRRLPRRGAAFIRQFPRSAEGRCSSDAIDDGR